MKLEFNSKYKRQGHNQLQRIVWKLGVRLNCSAECYNSEVNSVARITRDPCSYGGSTPAETKWDRHWLRTPAQRSRPIACVMELEVTMKELDLPEIAAD